MKFRNKHYFEIGMLPFILIPVIALTVGLTLWFGGSHGDKYALPYTDANYNKPLSPKDKLAIYEDKDNDELDDNDQAVFTFTGDTVLVLSDSDPLKNPPDSYRVLYKNKQGNLQVIDLPEAALLKVNADTTAAGNN